MSVLSRSELRTLIETPAGPCVSIFMPAHCAGPEIRQDPIRFQNLLRSAEEDLLTLKARQEASARYRELAGTGRASHDLRQIVPAAHHGRVETLFVAVGVQVWGTFEPGAGTVREHGQAAPGDEDLSNLAAIRTLIAGGTVYAVAATEVPDDASIAAILRY